MSEKERLRLSVFSRVQEGVWTLGDAAERLAVSYRQTLRCWARFRASGAPGLCHRSRGRRSNGGYPRAVQEDAVKRYQERYAELGMGAVQFSEYLSVECGGPSPDHETLRRCLRAAGLWRPRRRRKAHRKWRERRARRGELVQLDGSFHDWLGDGQMPCLMVCVDDATGETDARLFEQETTLAALEMLRRWVLRHGVPGGFYTDRKTVYHAPRTAGAEELLGAEAPLTAFGKACSKLGTKIIPAYSPQAKGRVERKNGVLQDRLVKALVLAGVRTIPAANAFLDAGFLASFNRQFEVAPRDPRDGHHPVPDGMDLAAALSVEEERTVANDWTVRYDGVVFQIGSSGKLAPPSKSKVTMQRRLDGSMHAFYRGQEVRLTVCLAKRPASAPLPAQRHPPVSPAADHPWRASLKRPTRHRRKPWEQDLAVDGAAPMDNAPRVQVAGALPTRAWKTPHPAAE